MKLKIRVVIWSVGLFLAASFVICVLFGLIVPQKIHGLKAFLEAVLPAFKWLSVGGFLLSLVALFSAFSMNGWPGPTANKIKLLRIHRFAGWITFSTFFFVGLICLVFHLPSVGPARVFYYGFFSIHPIAGVLGFVFYAGKILAVRKLHTAWKLPGILWGAGIFLAWILVGVAASLAYFNVLMV